MASALDLLATAFLVVLFGGPIVMWLILINVVLWRVIIDEVHAWWWERERKRQYVDPDNALVNADLSGARRKP